MKHRSEWSPFANCKGYQNPEDFHTKGRDASIAKLVCKHCPVRIDCLEYAVVHKERGIWGGLTERERRKLPSMVVEVLVIQYREGGYLEERPELDSHPVESKPLFL